MLMPRPVMATLRTSDFEIGAAPHQHNLVPSQIVITPQRPPSDAENPPHFPAVAGSDQDYQRRNLAASPGVLWINAPKDHDVTLIHREFPNQLTLSRFC